MDDPNKPSNDPVSTGNEKISNSDSPKAPTGKKPGNASKKKIKSSKAGDGSSEPEKAETSSGKNIETGETEETTAIPADEKTLQDTEAADNGETEEVSEIIPGPYHDPYDPDNIYGDYNEFYNEGEYAPEAERMPERPDDPHFQDESATRDRAGEEAAVIAAAAKSAKDSTDKKTSKTPPVEDDEEDDEEKELGGRMSFLDHLDELRKRIFHAMISIIVTFVGAWVFREQIFGFLSAPILRVVDQLVVLKPTEPFTVYLKVSFAAAIFFAIPYIMFQVWLFIAPGLYRKEKIYSLPFLFASSILFILGGMFAYYIILPPALNFLLNDFGSEFKAVISAVEFYDFELIIIVGMGAIFQLPVVVAFLSMFGLVSPGFMWRNFRYAFLLITIIAAVVSPTTDPMNLFLWSGPMVILYTFSIGISWIFKRRRDTKKKTEDERWSS